MSQKMYFIAINFFWTMWHQNWESLTFLRPTKQISSVPCKKRNFKVLVFKSRRSLWGHAWCHKKCILLTFKGICMNFSLELKKIILSHPMTSKQPHEIVQILMGHPVYSIEIIKFNAFHSNLIATTLKNKNLGKLVLIYYIPWNTKGDIHITTTSKMESV